MDEETAKQEVERLRKIVNDKKPKGKLYKSRLDKYKNPILKLKENGATLEEIQQFLEEKRIKVVLSTISRWLKSRG